MVQFSFPTPCSPALRRGLCLVIAGPSGSGKTTVMEALVNADENLGRSVSVTTRPPRDTEQDGVDYHFRTQSEFDELVGSDGMLEHSSVFERSYGIPKAPVQATLAAGTDLAFVIDWQGHRKLKEKLPGDVVGVFLLPPSLGALQSRMLARGDAMCQVRKRMQDAGSEMSHCHEFDHSVVNDCLEDTLAAVRMILEAARSSVSRSNASARAIR